jgi:ligand-binding sensor domain-containing protein/two-component sensor histidine kinase
MALSIAAEAQTSFIPDLKFRRLDTPQGLSSSQINCIFKDSKGFVWIGTPYGLNRYDGYRVKTFYSNLRDTTTMRDNYTDRVYEDAEGQLWMRQGMNYCVYDPNTETFERKASRALAKLGLNCNVEWLYIDSKKNIWVKDFEKAIYCYHPHAKENKITTIKMGYGINEFSPNFGISTVAEQGDRLLVVTNNGELICLNGDSGDVEWIDRWMYEACGIDSQEYRLYVDKDNNIWCNVLSFVFVQEHNTKKWYTMLDYLAMKGIGDVPSQLQVWNIIVDENDWLWLVCDHDAIVIVDMKNKQWRQFMNNKYDETSISDNTLRCIYQAEDGSIWIGSYKNGVNQYIRGLASLKSIDLGDITTACEDKAGNYWLGTNDQGILVYNPKTGEVVNHFTKDNSGLVSNIVVGSWAASDGTIWFGSYNGGLSHAVPSASDPTQAHIINVQASPGGLANNSVWALTEDKWGRIWFSTLGGGLQMWDPNTKKYTTWNTHNTILPSDYLTSVEWNKKGWLMTGTNNFYSLVNPVSHKLVNMEIPENPNVNVSVGNTNYVIEDSRGLIWHGSNVGVIVYDPQTKFQKLIDMTDGLPSTGVNSLVEDLEHAVWVVTDHGISKIIPQKQDDGTWQFTIRSFTSRDGLQKATYNQRSTWLTRDGKILIGGQAGLDIINPALLEENNNKERPIFSGLQIFDQDVEVGKKFNGRVILDEALDVCRELTLKFNDQFTIQLATNEVRINNHKRFAYKLEGFNENWVKTSELNPNITYNSLRAGSYTLYVRILNDDGSLGAEESQLDITILPPLYRTRWMILLYMILIAAGAWLFVKWYLKKQKEKADLEQLRREQDKHQWMSEMRARLMKESQNNQKVKAEGDEAEEVIHESESFDDKSFVMPAMPKLETHLSEGDIVAFLKNLCDNYKPSEDKKLKLTFNSPLAAIPVAFDEAQLRMAIEILLGNSVKFGPSTCKIQITAMKPSENRVALLLVDNGIGIPDEHKPHMFEPFLGDEKENLRLDKVKQIVDAHHGTIKVDDNPGGGTVFTISLPVEDPDIEEATIIEDES